MENLGTTNLNDVNDAIGNVANLATRPVRNTPPDITDRALRIIYELEDGPVSGYELATILDCPQASVRRTIQTLRNEGHAISYPPYTGGLYHLTNRR